MLYGQVIGRAHATVKHPSMNGWPLILVQPFGPKGSPDGDPQLCADPLGVGPGQRVVINSDGKFARETIGHDKSPVRFIICGIIDPNAKANL
jgi:ethanolamine utilization protein EutN